MRPRPSSVAAKGPLPPIPLTVLTGFLGAGKTTILNRLLRDPALADTVVIVNEFGEVGLDHLLIEAVEDGMVLLAAGCLCCTVRGDLVATLEDLLRRRDNGRIAPFQRVVIETTGLADPVPVLAAVLYHPYLSQRYAVQGVVTAIDAVNGVALVDRHPEALRQAAIADRIVITKSDLADEAACAALRTRLHALNPGAALVEAVAGDAPADVILGAGLFGLDGKIGDVAAWLGAERETGTGHDHAGHGHHHHHDVSRHDARIHSLVLTADVPLGQSAIDLFLGLVRESFGAGILRIKGLVDLVESPGRPVVIQGVSHVIHVPAMLPAWPDGDHRTRLVLIVEDVPRAAIERLWDAVSGRPAVDQPDIAALTDNPLAPATLAR
jgi:G3E family GTPase